MNIYGLTAADIIQLNVDHGGQGAGVADVGGVEAAAAQVFQTFDGVDLYPTLWEKSAALLRGLITTQYFIDGNKRTAWAAAEAFLEINDEELADIDDDEAETFALSVAAGKQTVEAIAEWLFEHAAPLPDSLDEHGICEFCAADGALPGAEIIPRQFFRRQGYRSDSMLQTYGPTSSPNYGVSINRPDRDLVPGVCEKCRSGWMRAIDRAGLEILSGIDQGWFPTQVGRRQLAVWAVKTALLRSTWEPSIPFDWRGVRAERLRTVQRVPLGWNVWLLLTHDVGFNLGRITFARAKDESWTSELAAHPSMVQWTFHFGPVVLVACFDDPSMPERWAAPLLEQMETYAEGALVKVWPGQGRVLPPSESIDLETIQVLAGQLDEFLRDAMQRQ